MKQSGDSSNSNTHFDKIRRLFPSLSLCVVYKTRNKYTTCVNFLSLLKQ